MTGLVGYVLLTLPAGQPRGKVGVLLYLHLLLAVVVVGEPERPDLFDLVGARDVPELIVPPRELDLTGEAEILAISPVSQRHIDAVN